MTASRRGLSSSTIPPRLRQSVRRKLLRWYDRYKRDLPWRRRAGDPYAQWVAEIMLQQTRVETVIPYYERFMKRFPTVQALARARHETVLKHWEGLGYYRRVLHLHNAARLLHREHRGLPTASTDLRSLSGVGEYTAAAIASIAYGEPLAAVDGNVARVVARLCGIDADILTPRGRKLVGEAANRLLARRRPGDFNQAWMDFGAAVCTPKAPRCDQCPLASDCLALAMGQAESLPVRDGNRKRPRNVSMVAVVFQCDGKVLLRRRPKGGLWSGLWEVPAVEVNGADRGATETTVLHHSHAEIDELAMAHGISRVGAPVYAGAVCHKLTHRSLTFHVHVADAVLQSSTRSGEPRALQARPDRRIPVRSSSGWPPLLVVERSQEVRWVTPQRLARLSVSTAHRKVLRAAGRTIESASVSADDYRV